MKRFFLHALTLLAVSVSATVAHAATHEKKPAAVPAAAEYVQEKLPEIGLAHAKQLGFQPASSPVMEKLTHLHEMLTIMAFVVAIFVLILLGYVCLRFRAASNPVPSTTTHNTLVEVVWTTLPILILVVIAVKSLPLHYEMDRTEKAEMTLNITGYQWYWGYEYPDNGGIAFESRIIQDADPAKEKELLAGRPRLLAVDNPVVIPVDTNVRIVLTGEDVIHSWAMPAMGVKTDAVPGRHNETWLRATQKGIFYGQCSELCGVNHGFMPIELHVVSKEEFAAWVQHNKPAGAATSALPAAPARIASAQ